MPANPVQPRRAQMHRTQPRANKMRRNNATILVVPVEEESAMILRWPTEQGQRVRGPAPANPEQSWKAQAQTNVARTNPRSRRANTPKQRNHSRNLCVVPLDSGSDDALAAIRRRFLSMVSPFTNTRWIQIMSRQFSRAKSNRRVRRFSE